MWISQRVRLSRRLYRYFGTARRTWAAIFTTITESSRVPEYKFSHFGEKCRLASGHEPLAPSRELVARNISCAITVAVVRNSLGCVREIFEKRWELIRSEGTPTWQCSKQIAFLFFCVLGV